MKKEILSKTMLTLLVVSAFTLALVHLGGSTGISEGWMRGEYDMAGTRYYPFPSKYHIPDKPFETLWASPHEGKLLEALTGDVNGDGKLEIVMVNGDNLRVVRGDGTVLWTETIPGDDSYYGTGMLRLNMLEDVTGDSVPEIFVSRKVSDTIQNIYVYDGNQNRIKTLSGTVGFDGLMIAAAVFDVDKDGDKEIFCNIGSNYAGNPRGACLFDYDTGAHLWYYAAGNAIGSSMADLNNDGVLEITGSVWHTVHNGAYGSGKGSNTYTDDSSIYMVVVNENGDEILTKQLHGVHNHGTAYAKIVDLDGDGTKEILIFHQHWALTYPGFAEIFLWDSNGNELKTYQGPCDGVWGGGPVIADINKDGKDEVLVWEKLNGALLVLDCNLNVIDSATDYVSRFANDLNGDGELEIVCGVVSTGELAVLDNNLNELWRLSFGGGAKASDVTGDGVNDLILTNADGLHVLSFPGLDATVDVNPDTLNLGSNGDWITAYIELPASYDVANIDVFSVLLNDTITVDTEAPATVGDYDDDGISDLMLKFNRFDVESYITAMLGTPGRFTLVTLTISGSLNEGMSFEGSEIIRVIRVRSGGPGQNALLR